MEINVNKTVHGTVMVGVWTLGTVSNVKLDIMEQDVVHHVQLTVMEHVIRPTGSVIVVKRDIMEHSVGKVVPVTVMADVEKCMATALYVK